MWNGVLLLKVWDGVESGDGVSVGNSLGGTGLSSLGNGHLVLEMWD